MGLFATCAETMAHLSRVNNVRSRKEVRDSPCTSFRKVPDTIRVPPKWPAHDGMGTNNLPTPAEVKANLAAAVDGESNIKDLKMVISAVADLERLKITPEDLLSTRLGLLVNNIRKKAADKALARRLKNLVRSWKEACTAPTQANPPLSHTVKPVGEPSAAVVRPPSVEPVPLVNSHNVQPAGEANRQAAPLSSALNFQAHSLTHPLHPFPQPSVGAEIETSATRPQIPLLPPPGAEPVPQAQEQCCTPPLPSSSPPKAVLHSLTVCIPLSQLPGPLVDRLRRPKERETGSHVAIVQQPSPPLPRAVDLPPNTVVLPPHSVVFPPRPLAPSPLTLPPSQPTINLVISIPLHKVAVRGAACERTLENGSSGFPCKPVGGATLNHTPSVLPKHLGFVPSSMGQESSDGICQQRVNEMHAEENSVVCWRYAWAGAEGRYSGIHGYFDHTGQWHDWTMPLPSHNDSVSVLPYVYID